MLRPTLIGLNAVELKCYPFMISLNKCSGSCNVSSPKISVPKKIKDIIVKTFNMISNQTVAKPITKHISCDCKCKFNSAIIVQSNQKLNNETYKWEYENYRTCQQD